MKTNLKQILGCLAAATALSLPGQAALAKDPVCQRTANKMLKSCHADARGDFHETMAACINLADGEERLSCREDVRDEREENLSYCEEQRDARLAACDTLGENRYDPDPLLDPGITFIDPEEIPGQYGPSPWVSLQAGHTYVLRAGEAPDFDDEIVVVHVTDESRDIQGVQCRIVVDIVVEEEDEDGEVDYEPVEVTDDWFAQDVNGDVYYCGEVARNFEDSILRDLDGSFESGLELAKAGVLVRNTPTLGEAHRQEYALGEAEDIVQYLALNASPTEEEGGDVEDFPCDDNCLKTFDSSPLEPESTEFKYYLPGVGFVLAVGLEDGELSGEREELVCVGDSLDILSDDDCDVADTEALLDALCEESDFFCAEDDEDEDEDDDDDDDDEDDDDEED